MHGIFTDKVKYIAMDMCGIVYYLQQVWLKYILNDKSHSCDEKQLD